MLAALKAVPRNLPHGLAPRPGWKGFLFDKGERAAMGAALGAVKGYYYDRAVFHGLGIELWVAAAGYLGAALLGNSGSTARHLERAGDAGLTTYMYALGAAWGGDKAGRGVASTPKQLPKGQGAQRSMPVQQQVVGVIPPRTGGAFLSADDIANNSAPRS